MTFPPGFLWGSASAAHQIEGDNHNTDWWEHEFIAEGPAKEPSGIACDSYHHFEEDFRLVAKSGQNAVRFSVEWARIEPSPGEFSNREFDHYREMIGSARDLGLETFVTLHHFTNPKWFADGGSWEKPESFEAFGRYAAKTTEALSDLLQTVNTINEPQVVASLGWVLGMFPPRKQDLSLGHLVTANLIKAHAVAVEAVRKHSDAKVGLPLSINEFVPADESEEAKQFRDFTHHALVGVYLGALREGRITGLMVPDEEVPEIEGTDDFVGIQYYTRIILDPEVLSKPLREIRPREGERVTQMGWTWNPDGLGRVIDEVSEIGLPIYITENGIATDDEDERIEYVTLHLEQVADSISRGRDVRGYFYWSYIDNFEWNEGFRPKFGLIGVDRSTMERIPKKSLEWYGAIARRNAL